MMERSDDGIILCQPDNGKGCSLCCGLFNFRDITHASLTQFLEDGAAREKGLTTYNDFQTPHGIRDEHSHICPYQGFLSAGKPGCLIHPLSSGRDGRERSLFASKICEKFFCPAHTFLSVEEKLFLTENVKHWLLYSIAIADPESFSFIYNYVKDNFADSGIAGVLVNEGLAAHAENLASCTGVIFSYSIPEYNINKMNFGLKHINKSRDHVVSRIIKYVEEIG